MAKNVEVEITTDQMVKLRDEYSGGSMEWAGFTVAIGLAKRLDRIIELLEEQIARNPGRFPDDR